MLKAVIFDVDGVLIKTRTADAATYQKMFTQAGYDMPSLEQIEAVNHLPLWEGVKILLNSSDLQEINRVRDILLPKDSSHRTLISPQQDLVAILQNLATKYRLGIATGRFREGMNELFKQIPIKEFFETIVTYEDTVKHKPSPDPLLLALSEMQVKPEESIYVGDMDYDIEAAKSAGVLSIHLASKKTSDATMWIRDFSDLEPSLDDISHTLA